MFTLSDGFADDSTFLNDSFSSMEFISNVKLLIHRYCFLLIES